MKSKRLFLKSICSLPLFLGFNHKLIAKPIETKHVKPKSVLLNQCPIAGFQYYQGKEVIGGLKENDELLLLAEPGNEHDKYAVEVYYQTKKLGYIPRKENRHISRILQEGVRLGAKVHRVDKDEYSWGAVQVAVYLQV